MMHLLSVCDYYYLHQYYKHGALQAPYYSSDWNPLLIGETDGCTNGCGYDTDTDCALDGVGSGSHHV